MKIWDFPLEISTCYVSVWLVGRIYGDPVFWIRQCMINKGRWHELLTFLSPCLSLVLTIAPLPECRKGKNCFENLNIFVREEFMSIEVWQGERSICVSSLSLSLPLFTIRASQGLIYWVNLISRAILLDVLFTVLNHDF